MTCAYSHLYPPVYKFPSPSPGLVSKVQHGQSVVADMPVKN
jgi:hypothetical protein